MENWENPKALDLSNSGQHEHALQALRKLNNNPKIFTDAHRPIVEFAIEDKIALNKRLRRILKSEQKKLERKDEVVPPKVKEVIPLGFLKKPKNKKKKKTPKLEEEAAPGKKDTVNSNFTGFKSEPLKATEPVAVPKINRKILESKKLIGEKMRKVKSEKKQEKFKKEAAANRNKKLERRKEAKQMKTSNGSDKEYDRFEKSFVQKGRNNKVLVRDDTVRTVGKKTKWFKSD